MARQPDIDFPPTVVVRLSGTGGQGLVLMGKLLAEAAGIQDGLNVVQTKAYGPEARGGASRSDVVLSPGGIDDLGGLPLDILVSLSQQACDKFFPELNPRGLLLVDSTNVAVVPTSRAVELPITATAVDVCKNKLVANVVALGALCGYSQVVRLESLQAAIKANVRPAYHDLNMQALQAGYDMARELLNRRPAMMTYVDFSFLREAPAKPKKVNGAKSAKGKAKAKAK